jgi:hypothetical protein
MKVTVTVKSEGATRPSGHKLSPLFSGKGFDHEEIFTCAHAKEHGLLICKLLDLIAIDCGTERQEFKADDAFAREMSHLMQHIESLHEYITRKQ